MLFKFNDFVFNSESLVLTKGNESIEIRPNEAKLLALLLKQADQVIAKDEILSQVWQGKVVSEQAVFQNISNLRSLFGNESIKTYPKRGYQWKLAFKVETTDSDIAPILEQNAGQHSSQQRNLFKPVFVLVSLVVLVLVLVYTNLNEAVEPIDIAYVPIKDKAGKQVITLASDRFTADELTHLDHWRFMAGIELEYNHIKQQHPLILTGKVREFNDAHYLNFLLKGPAGDWSGTLTASSPDELNQKLNQHLSNEFVYQLVSEPHTNELKQAILSLAHQEFPDDTIVLGHLVETFRAMNEFEKAMVLAEKLESVALATGNSQLRGKGLYYQAEVLQSKKLYDLSAHKLDLAEQEFKKVADLTGQSEVWQIRSIIALIQKDYPRVRQSLTQAANLAEQDRNVEQELHSLTYLSVLAHKFKQEEDKYTYLYKAEQKMKDYQLPQYRFAKIPFHYAIYSASIGAKEPHLKQVLEFTKLTPDHWVAQVSRKLLVKYYLDQERLIDAAKIVALATSENAENFYLKALLAQANDDEVAFVKYAKKTFEQAELTGDTELSLNAALILYEQPDIDANAEFYAQYIVEHATERWRRDNERKLLSLNL